MGELPKQSKLQNGLKVTSTGTLMSEIWVKLEIWLNLREDKYNSSPVKKVSLSVEKNISYSR